MHRALMVLACCCATTARAALLQYEPFDYTNVGGSIEGQTAPTGGTWVAAYSSAVAPGLIKIQVGDKSQLMALAFATRDRAPMPQFVFCGTERIVRAKSGGDPIATRGIGKIENP